MDVDTKLGVIDVAEETTGVDVEAGATIACVLESWTVEVDTIAVGELDTRGTETIEGGIDSVVVWEVEDGADWSIEATGTDVVAAEVVLVLGREVPTIGDIGNIVNSSPPVDVCTACVVVVLVAIGNMVKELLAAPGTGVVSST